MRNTLLTITRTTAENKVSVRTLDSKVFTVPSTWCYMGTYRGTESFVDSAGATITVAPTVAPDCLDYTWDSNSQSFR